MTNEVSYWKILTRKKVLPNDEIQSSKLGRVLGTLDLAALGIGATLGVGVYVLAGHVSRDQAGPSVILSFLIAAAASFLAGLCYAEFGARVPKSGSAYIYSYVCIGEFIAFVIGWNLLLEYIIGSASVSKGLSLYLDTLLNDTFKRTFTEIAPMHWDFLAEYFDFFSFGIPLLLGVAMAFGLRKSAIINNIFTVSNILIVLFVIIAGSFKADIANWSIPKPPPEYNAGEGGFFPFGFSGTLKGAATCFFGYVGFDCIATTGEEVQNPKKAIPMAILISLFTIFMAYFGVSTVLTLMWPYYLQDVNAPLPHVFNEIGWYGAKWVVAIGGIFGLIASLFGAMFPLPRIIYAIAQDGLIFRFLGDVNAKFQTPVTGTLCAALLTGTFSALFDLKALVNMLSIGTLLAYTVVAISILILRFSNNLDNAEPPSYNDANANQLTEGSGLTSAGKVRLTSRTFVTQFFNIHRIQRPDSHSMAVAGILVMLYVLAALGLALTIFFGQTAIMNMEPWALALTGIFLFLAVILLVALGVQPRERTPSEFTVPLVPLLPGVSIFINIFLMLMLDYYTWIRFAIWMAIDFVHVACFKIFPLLPPVGVPIYIACVFCKVNSKRKSSLHLRHLQDVVKLNGTINKAYEKEFDEHLKELEQEKVPQITANSTISRTAAAEIDEILQKAVLTVENQYLEVKPPSPTKSFDEIVPESEVIDQLTEKKAGNGALYFTDEIKTDDENDEIDDGDTTNAIAMLDDVLEDEELMESRKISDASNMMPHSHEAIATAVVHHENMEEENEEIIAKSDQNNNEKVVEDPKILEEPLKEEEKPVFASIDPENSDNNKEFIKKLNTLFQQKTVPNRKFVPNDEDDTLQQSPSKRPSLLHSRSEHVTLERHPAIDKETGEPLFLNESSNIPKAPVFDAELYRSLGRSKSSVVLRELDNIDDEPPRLRKKKYSAPQPPVSPEIAEKDDKTAIKEKLEAIFRNSLPRMQMEAKSLPPNPVVVANLEQDSNQDKENSSPQTSKDDSRVERVSSFKTKAKKFDTVEKQKAIFANVIREINPDKPKSLQRTPSFDRRQLTEVFKVDNSDSRRSSARSNIKLPENSDKSQENVPKF
ncbi:cationic amino acid transporter 2-like [Culicoides brevitarsis]|uniref:cationic amino acid transporter 2-like n=1 Tax=Culicoides brevitarsis TaxID=469753 RepID=UPI00307C685E